jgi:hypothetical protein
MHGIYVEYSGHKLEMTRKEYVRHSLDIVFIVAKQPLAERPSC